MKYDENAINIKRKNQKNKKIYKNIGRYICNFAYYFHGSFTDMPNSKTRRRDCLPRRTCNIDYAYNLPDKLTRRNLSVHFTEKQAYRIHGRTYRPLSVFRRIRCRTSALSAPAVLIHLLL